MKVEWSEEGRTGLAQVYAFNTERSEEWAARVENRLRERAEALAATPLIGRGIAFGLRALSVPDIRYVILYRVGAQEATILGVKSTREQRDWQ